MQVLKTKLRHDTVGTARTPTICQGRQTLRSSIDPWSNWKFHGTSIIIGPIKARLLCIYVTAQCSDPTRCSGFNWLEWYHWCMNNNTSCMHRHSLSRCLYEFFNFVWTACFMVAVSISLLQIQIYAQIKYVWMVYMMLSFYGNHDSRKAY